MNKFYLLILIPFLFSSCVNKRGVSAKYYSDCKEYYDLQGYYHKDCDEENMITYKEMQETAIKVKDKTIELTQKAIDATTEYITEEKVIRKKKKKPVQRNVW